MRRQELSVTYAAAEDQSGTISANIVQDDIPDNTASLGDLNQMIARALAGQDARSYMIDACPAATLQGNILTISMDFFVYASRLDLQYTVTPAWGIVSPAIKIQRQRRFDIIFDGVDSAELQAQFYGSFIPAMPFFDLAGRRIATPTIQRDGFVIKLSQSVYGVMRAIGEEVGYRHTVSMPITIEPGMTIYDIKNHITLVYDDGSGTIVAKQLTLKIPQCCIDLLALCDNGLPKIVVNITPPDKLIPTVYYSDCTGYVIAVRYEKS